MTPAVEARELRLRYDPRGQGMSFPDLSIEPDEQLAIVGRSGSGKSTLLHLLAGLVRPTGGCVRIGGQDLHAIGEAARDRFRGRHIGMVFQTFNLLAGLSAIENILVALMFGNDPPRTHRDRAATLLAHLGLDRPDAMPDELSVGQQQRIAVARALACRPTVVLADEPTASLDPETGAVAVDLLQRACREEGSALVCVSHDPAVAARFPRVVRLDEAPTEAGAWR